MSLSDFQKRLPPGIVLVDFGVSWCAPCRIQEKIMDSLLHRFSHRAKVVVVDLDKHRELAADFFIENVPTLILFRNGKEIRRFVGLQSEEMLSRAIENVIV